MNVKYIFVTGGVVSGLGKGITAASLGRLLKARGLRVTMQKFDPYINVDPGTMSPYQHGEVFVTDDGAETDLDIGHYERFIDENLDKYSNVTTGKVYLSVIKKERKSEFLGETVQVIPHITNEIKERVQKVAKLNHTDVVITEIGGTVGDIESLPFLEAIRQFSTDMGRDNVMFIHVTLVPFLGKAGELKTKPTQHSVKELRGIGIQPDIIVCRTENELSKELKDKIALFCNVPSECVIQNMDVEVLYEVPLMMEKENLGTIVCKRLKIENSNPDLVEWKRMVHKQKNFTKLVNISLVGKYTGLYDAYLSITEALDHGGIANDTCVKINWINSENVTDKTIEDFLKDSDGILIPGGFGNRGIKGKIAAVKYARENNIPFFGICLGMQMAVVEYSRNVCHLGDANSSEFDSETKYNVIDLLATNQKPDFVDANTMRLGLHSCKLIPNSHAFRAYGLELIKERHRHRYGLNKKFEDILKENGLVITGYCPEDGLAEIIELPNHPWFVGVQFHPEFKSRPNRPHPLFKDFIKAALENKRVKE